MVRRVIFLSACAVVSSIYNPYVLATPYASGVSESAGVVTFRLNEPADNVTILRDGTPTSLGALPAGTSTFPRSGATNYQIIVKKSSAAGYNFFQGNGYSGGGAGTTIAFGATLRVSDDTANLNKFQTPRGLAVMSDPTSSAFGRIFVSNGTPGTFGGRTVGRGIYALNSDHTDALGFGDTATTAGIPFVSTSTSSPYKLEVGPDNRLYIADFSDGNGGLYRMESDLTNGVNVFAGNGDLANPTVHGSMSASPLISGTVEGGNMKVYSLDEDMVGDPPTSHGTGTNFNSLFRWDVGAGPLPYNTPPTKLTDFPSTLSGVQALTVDVARSPGTGKIYLSENRSAGVEPGLFVTDDTGAVLWDSLTTTRTLTGNAAATDMLKEIRAISVSPDGKFIAAVSDGSDVSVIPLDAQGIPDLANSRRVDVGTISAGRDVAVDAAGNIYVVSSGDHLLMETAPGGLTTTTYSSAGTFSSTQSNHEWIAVSGGLYTDSSKWLSNSVPSGSGYGAKFGSSNSGPSNVDIGAAGVTLGFVLFDSPNSYTVSGTGTLVLDSAANSVGVAAVQGGHTISAPIQVNKSLVVSAGTLSTLTLSNVSYATGLGITKNGAGTVSANKYVGTTVNVKDGVLKTALNGGTSYTTALTLAGANDAWTSSLDLNEKMVMDYATTSPSPLSTVQNQLKNGYAAGAWNGKGITSSSAAASQAAANKGAIAYFEASQTNTTSWGDITTIDGTAVLLMYTSQGDATLDGKTNTLDFNILAGQFGATNATYVQGDFTYDGSVDSADFGVLVGNFGASITLAPAPTLGAVVPEPATLALLGLAPLAMLRRRR